MGYRISIKFLYPGRVAVPPTDPLSILPLDIVIKRVHTYNIILGQGRRRSAPATDRLPTRECGHAIGVPLCSLEIAGRVVEENRAVVAGRAQSHLIAP